MPDSPFSPEQAIALRRLRLRWLVALMTNLPLPFIVLPITGSAWLEQQPGGAASQAMLLAVVLGVGSVLLGLFTRNQVYKANWRGEVISPDGYVKANTLLFAAINCGAYALFVLSVVKSYPAPTFAAAPVYAGLLAFNFPNGRPMQPAPPRIDLDGDLS